MASAIEFQNALTRWTGERLPEIVRAINTEFIGRLGSGVVFRTPVRTGRARGNWRLLIGKSQRPGVQQTYDPDGTITVLRIIAAAERAAVYSSFTLYNAVPYVKHLENGSSQQAPLGMMRVTLDELKATWKTAMKAAGQRVRGRFYVR